MSPLHVSPRLLLFIQSHLMLQPNDPSIYDTLDRMELFGGGFVAKLVAAFKHADQHNKERIIAAFPELFEEYGPNSVFASKDSSIQSMGYSMVKHLSIRK